MAGGTSGFNMIQSSKDNRSIRTSRSMMADNPYLTPNSPILNRNPEHYDEMIAERFDRKEQYNQNNKLVLFIFGVMVVLAISLFFI